MECPTKTKSFISIPQLVIILVLLLSVGLSGAATPYYIGNSSAVEFEVSGLSLSAVEFEAGAVVLSTWESASTHRILQQIRPLNVYNAIMRLPACNSRKYSGCIGTPSGAAARPCNNYNRCSRNSQR